MSNSYYTLSVDLSLTTRAVSRQAAIDHAGQIVEQLAIRMARVLTRLEITRHDVEADFASVAQTGNDGTPVGKTVTLAYPFRLLLHAAIDMRADSEENCIDKTMQLLGAVPEQMGSVIEKYSISDLDAKIVKGPTRLDAFPQGPVPKQN